MSVTQEQVIQLIQSTTKEVFSMMLGLEVEYEAAFEEAGASESFAGVVALVGIAGPWSGIGTLYCGTELALQLTGSMLMQEQTSVNDEVLDAMAELSNMIIGNVKTALEEELGPLVLSIPTVIYGRNYKALNGMGKKRVVVPFSVDGKQIWVKFCLIRQEEGTTGRHSALVHSMVQCPG